MAHDVVLNLPKDLGDGLIASPAIDMVCNYCQGVGAELFVTGGKFQRDTIATLTGIELALTDPAELANVKDALAINLNFYDKSALSALPASIPVFSPKPLKIVGAEDPAYAGGAILGEKHISELLFDCLKEAGIVRSDVMPTTPVLNKALMTNHRVEFARAELGLDGDYAVFVPVCAADRLYKRWQPEKFAEIARKFYDEKGITPVFAGGPVDAERELTAKINDMTGNIGKVMHSSIGTAASILSDAEFVLSNDTGLYHIAAASGRPSYGIFVYEMANTWNPKRRNAHAISAEKAKGVHAITVETVYNEITKGKPQPKLILKP